MPARYGRCSHRPRKSPVPSPSPSAKVPTSRQYRIAFLYQRSIMISEGGPFLHGAGHARPGELRWLVSRGDSDRLPGAGLSRHAIEDALAKHLETQHLAAASLVQGLDE